MTIGIGAFGPMAGLAVYRALRAAEKIGTGSIGGFATFAAITDDGRPIFAVTQRGGAATAFTEGETTGVEPWPEFATAKLAAVISSGPDRPGDLTSFIPIDPAVGFVTGHRSPSTIGSNGKPMNADALARMRAGASASEVAVAVTGESPQADCGIICVDIKGQMGVSNTVRVVNRPDVAQVVRHYKRTGAAVAVLHNAIFPRMAVAEIAAAVAMETMTADLEPEGFITITAGTPICKGDQDAVFCNESGRVLRVTTTDAAVGLRARLRIAAPYLASAVWLGDTLVGRSTLEPIAIAEGGRLITFDGKDELRVGFCRELSSVPPLIHYGVFDDRKL
ncbi:hypothetical protein QA633_08330 [Bradyrhizobium barranii]|uniref:DUF6963 family protein n=1 Tax=Bradyrhizobium barranii TaxID=2992140 RepID=UPI0024B0C4E6|nr:hypothetical protein [Bradyrhizobium barranii]WFT97041.1 hypothetical protein QA633_08330 [Bradyrhizobium barranii]